MFDCAWAALDALDRLSNTELHALLKKNEYFYLKDYFLAIAFIHKFEDDIDLLRNIYLELDCYIRDGCNYQVLSTFTAFYPEHASEFSNHIFSTTELRQFIRGPKPFFCLARNYIERYYKGRLTIPRGPKPVYCEAKCYDERYNGLLTSPRPCLFVWKNWFNCIRWDQYDLPVGLTSKSNDITAIYFLSQVDLGPLSIFARVLYHRLCLHTGRNTKVPLKLQHYARETIRSNVACDGVRTLPLPKPLQEYLLYMRF